MTRRRIELHNIDKYQPYFHAPLIDRIEGDAQEMILSADGNETSTSNNTTGSLTINASGGVWMDLGVVNQLVLPMEHTHTDTSATSVETFWSAAASLFTQATLNVVVSSESHMSYKRVELLHDGSSVDLQQQSTQTIGTEPAGVTITSNMNAGQVQLQIENLGEQANIRGVATLIKI